MTAKKSVVVTAVDVFCGAAGLSLGLKQAGIDVRAGIDLDPACRFPFEQNIGAAFLERDVSTITGDELRALFGDGAIRVLAGCAPCQPFSGYTTRRRAIDDRWQLLLEFLRLTKESLPEIVTMENVPRLVHLPLWGQFVKGLEEVGYNVNWGVLDASLYGVPQNRRRLVLVASRLGPIGLPKPRKGASKTVREAIGALPSIRAGQRNSQDKLHSSRALTDRNLLRIRASKPAGTWREWPTKMQVACHREETGKTYPSVYGRMSWDQSSPTITTQFYGYGNGRFGHPEQDRAISLREGALLQSFPSNFKFAPDADQLNFRSIGKLIGNAVPPKLGKAIGSAIMTHLSSSKA
ncbi:DNA cytosine methyltransferase [Bradyrhizobium sp. Ai1a-2]|uniref:DNA cytosine methyltransferase n=1 Tax=Bradyrhizobium sp. Ai1a-2 TaxID=196490 RepID=UPI000429AD46|nr:DNA cytosine methyltransferase [Bradyrhizobium sp. Ai1a-2]